jgi:retron-type reverse transcriptase
MVIAKELEPITEPWFSENSYGYRPNRNAHHAIGKARENCWRYAWVIDMDIKGFFDNIDHGLMIRALRYFTEKSHIITYVKRWLKAPIQKKDGILIRNEEKGTPQGGVISPVLANIFLHVAFDKWMEINFPDCPFERYADDGAPSTRTAAIVFSGAVHKMRDGPSEPVFRHRLQTTLCCIN